MFFDKKLQRSFEMQQFLGDQCCKKEKEENEDSVEIEKKDILAMIIAGLMVFGPLFLLIGGIAFLLTM